MRPVLIRRTEEHQSCDNADDNEDSIFDTYCENEDFLVVHSPDYFERMAPRVNLQVLGSHIRDFGQRTTIVKKSYEERTHEALKLLEQKIGSLTNGKNADEIENAISQFEFTISDVYFSLGMKAGARLNALLMGGFDKDY